MGRAKRKKKKTENRNAVALIVAVILTALVIFCVRGGFGLLRGLLFKF